MGSETFFAGVPLNEILTNFTFYIHVTVHRDKFPYNKTN
jgi:hypothetical protein